jgi:hypothetical protein
MRMRGRLQRKERYFQISGKSIPGPLSGPATAGARVGSSQISRLSTKMLAEVPMHLGSLVMVIWLVIGGVAAGQRGDFSGYVANCSKASTIAVTILAGPLNYVGVDPDINCATPQPSN